MLYYTYSEITKLKQLGYSLTHTTFAFCTPIKLVYFTVHTYLQEPGKGNFTLGEREGGRQTLLNYELLYDIKS